MTQTTSEHVIFWLPGAEPGTETADVERVNHNLLYELGKTLRIIRERVELDEQPAREMHWPLRNGLRALDSLLKGDLFPLGISKTATSELRAELYSVWELHFTTKGEDGKRKYSPPPEHEVIRSWTIGGIAPRLDKFETIFSTEMSEAATYFVPARGIYSTAALIDFADKSFPSDISGHVPEKAKTDWRAAGRCLAFTLFSASGFHVARAVEGTMEAYYQLFSGRPGKTLRSWDDYHKELDKIRTSNPTPSPEEKTMIEFDQMRRDYRNPIVHPRVSLDESDARILFNNGESLIIAMASEIRRAQATQGGVQPTLSLISPGSTP